MKTRWILPLVFFSLVFSACTVRVNTDINSDGSGEWRIEYGFTAEDKQQLLQEMDSSVEEFCQDEESLEGLPEGASYSLEERGDETWCIFTIPFSNLAELRQLYTQDSEGEFIVNRLEIVDGTLYYDLVLDMGTSDGTGGVDDAGADYEFIWALTLPGAPTTHNADQVDGRTLTWDLTTREQMVPIQAQSRVGGGLPVIDLGGGDGDGGGGIAAILGVLLCCLCLIVLAGGGVAAFLIIRRRNASDA